MGNDDFEEDRPGDDEAEDFANFDPSSYLRKRGHGLDRSLNQDEPLESDNSDFANFDPNAYVRRRRAEAGQPQRGDPAVETGYGTRSRRRRRQAGMDDADYADVGAGAGLLGSFLHGENFGLLNQIVRAGGPFVRPLVVAVGCFLVLTLIGICTVAVLVFNSLNRR